MSRFFSALLSVCLGVFCASAHANVWISNDQLTYTEVISGRAVRGEQNAQIIYDGSQFLVTGERAVFAPLMTSVDGNSWVLRFDPTTPPPNNSVVGVSAIAYAASSGRYVTTQTTQANGTQFLHSTDLSRWTAVTLPVNWPSTRLVGSIASNGTGFVAVSNQEGLGTLVSPDGISWTHILPPGGIGTGIGPDKIHFFNGKYYGIMRTAFSNSLFEFDETTLMWTQYPVANLNTGLRWADVAFSNGTFAIVAANSSTVLTSTNKTTWTSHSIPTAGGVSVFGSGAKSIRDNGNGFIAVGGAGSGSNSYAVTGVLNAGAWTWTPTVITSAGNYFMTDVIVLNGKTVVVGRVTGAVDYTVSSRVSAAGGGSVSASTITVGSGNTVSFLASPSAGNVLLSVSGCGATFIGNTITTAAVTANCTVTVTFGVAPVACTLDIDDDGAVLPTTDVLLVLRRMLTLGDEALRAQAHNPLGKRTDPVAMAALIDPMIATKTLDIDGNGSVTAATDGLLLLRALLGFSGTTVTNGALGAGTKTRGDWALIRQYLSGTCGLGAILAP